MRTLKVQGKGHISVKPDIVRLSFNVKAENLDYGACLNALNEQVERLRQSIFASGLEITNLKTSSYDVRVMTEYEDEQRIFLGYSASHRMHIELPVDKDILNKVLSNIAQDYSGTEINISFSVKDKDSLRKKVLAGAVRTAMENAEIMASASGIKLGKIIQMSYGWSEVHIYEHDFSIEAMRAEAPYFEANIEPEDISTSDVVTLVYELTD